jgi:hypothetical protein
VTKGNGGPPGVTLIVTKNRPEDAPERLAVRLAEVINGIANLQADVRALTGQADAERKKAKGLDAVIFQLRERERNPPAQVRRMDPLATYDMDACIEERDLYQRRAKDLQDQAARKEREKGNFQMEMVGIQSKLAVARRAN